MRIKIIKQMLHACMRTTVNLKVCESLQYSLLSIIIFHQDTITLLWHIEYIT